METLCVSFLLSIVAGVVANFISKWLDRKNNNGNQPME